MGKEAGKNLSPSAVTVISSTGISLCFLPHGFSLESKTSMRVTNLRLQICGPIKDVQSNIMLYLACTALKTFEWTDNAKLKYFT